MSTFSIKHRARVIKRICLITFVIATILYTSYSLEINNEKFVQTSSSRFLSNNHQQTTFSYHLSRTTHDPTTCHSQAHIPFSLTKPLPLELFSHSNLQSFDYTVTQGQWDNVNWGLSSYDDNPTLFGLQDTPVISSSLPLSSSLSQKIHSSPSHGSVLSYTIDLPQDDRQVTDSKSVFDSSDVPISPSRQLAGNANLHLYPAIERSHTQITASLSRLFCSALSQVKLVSAIVSTPQGLDSSTSTTLPVTVTAALATESLCTEHLISLRQLLPLSTLLPPATTLFHSSYLSFQVIAKRTPLENCQKAAFSREQFFSSSSYLQSPSRIDITVQLTVVQSISHTQPRHSTSLPPTLVREMFSLPPSVETSMNPLHIHAIQRPLRPNTSYLRQQLLVAEERLFSQFSEHATASALTSSSFPSKTEEAYVFGHIDHDFTLIAPFPPSDSSICTPLLMPSAQRNEHQNDDDHGDDKDDTTEANENNIDTKYQRYSTTSLRAYTTCHTLAQYNPSIARHFPDLIILATHDIINHTASFNPPTPKQWVAYISQGDFSTIQIPRWACSFTDDVDSANSSTQHCATWILHLFSDLGLLDSITPGNEFWNKPQFLPLALPSVIDMVVRHSTGIDSLPNESLDEQQFTISTYSLILNRFEVFNHLISQQLASHLPSRFPISHENGPDNRPLAYLVNTQTGQVVTTIVSVDTLMQWFSIHTLLSANLRYDSIPSSHIFSISSNSPLANWPLFFPSVFPARILAQNHSPSPSQHLQPCHRIAIKHFSRVIGSAASTALSNTNAVINSPLESSYIQSNHVVYWSLLTLSSDIVLKYASKVNAYLETSPNSGLLEAFSKLPFISAPLDECVSALPYTPRPLGLASSMLHQGQLHDSEQRFEPTIEVSHGFASSSIDYTQFVVSIDVRDLFAASSSSSSSSSAVQNVYLVRHQITLPWTIGDIYFNKKQLFTRKLDIKSQVDDDNDDEQDSKQSSLELISPKFSSESILSQNHYFEQGNVLLDPSCALFSTIIQSFATSQSFNSSSIFSFPTSISPQQLQTMLPCVHSITQHGQSFIIPHQMDLYFLVASADVENTNQNGPLGQISVSIPLVKALSRVNGMPTDISRGLDLPPALTTLFPVVTPVKTAANLFSSRLSPPIDSSTSSKLESTALPPSSTMVILPSQSLVVTTLSSNMIVPYGDASMPFNATAIVATLVAFAFGSLFNLLFTSNFDFILLQKRSKFVKLVNNLSNRLSK